MTSFELERLRQILNAFSPTLCDGYTEYCIVALEKNNHKPGSILRVTGREQKEFSLLWNKKFSKAGYKMETKVTENAAVAISSFLCKELTEYAFVEEARIGTGIDFWLSYEEDHPLYDSKNFFQARIEIRGIDKENGSNTIMRAFNIKKVQVNARGSSELPAYISVVEFYSPKAYFDKV